MQRQLGRALTTSIYPLIGLAGLIAMSGCAAVPAISLANSLLKPAPPVQPALPAQSAQSAQPGSAGTAAPSSDIFSALAQRLGITLPAAPAANSGTAQSQTQAGSPSALLPGATATASK